MMTQASNQFSSQSLSPAPSAARNASHAASPRERGTVLLLVVVTLVLLALMGTAYLQIAQVDRLASRELAQGNIDSVVNAIVSDFQSKLLDDLFDDNGKMFNASATAAGAGDECYDYPWTNPANIPENTFQVTLFAGGTGNARGKIFSDRWLSSTIISDPAGTPAWRKITNPTGIFLKIPQTGGTTKFPGEDVVDFSTAGINSDANQTLASLDAAPAVAGTWDPLGVDADGDGIRDSRWTWAPIRQIGPTAYVMACRVIDSSSLIPINGATVLTSDGDNAFAATRPDNPRGLFPTDLDLSRSLKRSGAAAWQTELYAVLVRRGVSATKPTPFDMAKTVHGSRVNHWFDSAKVFGNPANKYDISDELELRFGFVLNVNSNTTTLEGDLPTVLRSGAAGEGDYTAVAGVTNIAQWMQGGTGAVSGRTFGDVRKMLTTHSGAAIFSANHNSIHDAAAVRTLRYDLVDGDGGADGGSVNTRVTNIAALIEKVFNIGQSDATRYLGNIGTPPTADDRTNITREYAAAIQDYADSDFEPTPVSLVGGGTAYGLEIMPFIREVYVQVGYAEQDRQKPDPADPDPMNPTMPPVTTAPLDGKWDTWEVADRTQAIAIEIGNPFDRPIPANELTGRIKIVIVQGGTDRAEFTFTAAAAAAMAAGDKLVIYDNPENAVVTPALPPASKNNIEEPVGTTRLDLATDLGLGATSREVTFTMLGGNPVGSLFAADGTDITIELRVNVGGNFVTYDRLTETGFALPAAVDHWPDQTDPATAPNRRDAHGQASLAREGEGRRYLSNQNKKLTVRVPDFTGYRTTGNNPVDTLEDDIKGNPGALATGSDPLDTFQIPIANRRFFSTAELGWIFMFGFTDQANGDFPSRFSGTDGSGADGSGGGGGLLLRRRTLDLTSAAVIPDVNPAIAPASPPATHPAGLPHGAMLLGQFTTVSLMNDGYDDDNSDNDAANTTADADNAEEQFVPYKININTAPLHIQTLAAPMPETMAEIEALMTSINTYRDNPSSRTALFTDATRTSLRAKPGIASIGELAYLSNATPANNMVRWALDGANQGDPGAGAGVYRPELDQFPLPEQSLPNDSDKATDDAEEQLHRFQFLTQAFDVRTDVIVLYCVVKGYPSADFSLGATESAKFIAVLDRGGAVDPNSEVKVLGILRIQ